MLIHELELPPPLDEEELAWLNARDAQTSWNGDEFVRVLELRARRSPPETEYAGATQSLRQLERRCLELKLKLPPELATFVGPGPLEHALRVKLDSLRAKLPEAPAPVPDWEGVFVVPFLLDCQDSMHWALLLDQQGDHRVGVSMQPAACEPPARWTGHICAQDLSTFAAGLLTELATASA